MMKNHLFSKIALSIFLLLAQWSFSFHLDSTGQERLAYWLEGNSIVSLNVDTGETEVVFNDSTVVITALAYDPIENQLYIAGGRSITGDLGDSGAYLVDLVESEVKHLFSASCGLSGGFLTDIELNPINRKVYVMVRSDCSGVLISSNLDGSDRSGDLIEEIPFSPYRMTMDHESEDLYWIEYGLRGFSNQIWKATLDGVAPSPVLNDFESPEVILNSIEGSDIAFDRLGQKIYWTGEVTQSSGSIQRANLDGTGVETVLDGLDNPTDLALDIVGSKIYWIEMESGTLYEANLDGSEKEDLITGLSAPRHLVLSFENDGVTLVHVEQEELPFETTWSVFPNPSLSEVTVSFQLNKPSSVEIKAYDLLGRKIADLTSSDFIRGDHQIKWNPRDTAHGMYLIRLNIDGNISTRQIIVL